MNKINVDTTTFEKRSPEGYKEQAKAHWSETPCGANYTEKDILNIKYFEEIEKYRYHTHPWIKSAIYSFDLRGKNVLEIGFGMGTDHLSLARQGGKMHGVDLTPRHLDITRKRLLTYGFESSLLISDAEKLPYNNSTFDFVYSFGVVHHTPSSEKVIAEIYRVLKPGGICWVTVYHKNSIFFWWTILIYSHILRGGWKKWSLKETLSLIEYPGNNPNLIVRLYKRDEFAKLFKYFSRVTSSIKHLLPDDISLLSNLYPDPERPRKFFNRLGKLFGWYVIIKAQK